MSFRGWKLWGWKDLPHDAQVKITIYFRRPTLLEPKGYISAYSGSSKHENETWHRGNDLSDGKWDQNTVNRIKKDIDDIFAAESTLREKDNLEIFNSLLALIKSFLKIKINAR